MEAVKQLYHYISIKQSDFEIQEDPKLKIFVEDFRYEKFRKTSTVQNNNVCYLNLLEFFVYLFLRMIL